MRRHLSRAWWLSVVLLLLLALLLTAARLGLQHIDRWRPNIQAVLSEMLGVPVDIGRLQGQWNYAYPVLNAQNISIRTSSDEGIEGHLKLQQLTLELDPFASLLSRAPVFHRFEASDVSIRWNQRGGAWLHRPGAAPGATSEGIAEAVWERLVAVLLQQPYAVIRNVELTLVPEQGQSLVITPADLELENARQDHRLSGLFRMPLLGEAAEMKFIVEAESVKQRALDARYQLYLELNHLGPELFQLFGQQLGIEQLNLNTRIWSSFDQRQLQHVQAEVELEQLDVAEAGLPYPRSGGFSASLQPRGDEYQLQLTQLQLAHEAGRFELPMLMVQAPLSLQPHTWKAGVAELDLGALSSWLAQAPGLPVKAGELLEALNPQGKLQQLSVQSPAGANWQDLQFEADLDRLQVAAWHGAPALEGISGSLKAGLRQGRIDLISDDFVMHFPELFSNQWRYPEAQGRITWALDDRGIRVASERLQLKDPHIQASGRFSIDLPFDRGEQSELVLLIGMTDSDGSQASIYTPAREVGEGLHRWLEEALQGGRLRQGGLLLRTGTRRNDSPRAPVVQLFFDVAEGQLAYQPEWPAVEDADLFVLVRDAGLAININRARLLNSTITSGWVYLPPGERQLQIEAELNGPVGDLDHVLKETPLAKVLGPSIRDWSLSEGKALSRLGLGIPLQAKPPLVNLNVALEDVTLSGQSGNLNVSDIQGVLKYTTGAGLNADGLQGRFLEQPVSADIKTEGERYRIQLEGRAEMERLQRWLQLPVLQLTKGTTAWQGQLQICSEREECPQLEIQSDLQGVELELPGILAKSVQQIAPLKLKLGLSPEVMVKSLDLQLPADGIAPLKVSAQSSGEPLELRFEHPQLTGNLVLANESEPLSLDLEHLQLDALMPAKQATDAEGVSATPAVANRFGGQLPVARVRIQDLWFAQKPLGDWRFALEPSPGRLRIRDLQAYPEQFVLRGEADWIQAEGGSTAVTLKLVGDDLGRLLKSWGHGRVMETQQVEAMLQLQWPNAPWQFDLAQLDGEFQFSTAETRLIETADSTNFLRIFGILNFNSLARRLRLDFSDLFKRGVSFDRISGHYRIENGVATTLEPLRMEGPSANMALTGHVDLAAEELDNRVEVTLPITSNAPLAAILLGAPQVAGAVFVIDKLIGDKLERFSTLKYSLKGHWDDPQLELQAGSEN
ncbi:YhdP family protein [Marinobacterium sediminicola]|uniref:TIGR02099 family protein n=1 Tax=Marinobacterium sediminicola TaxID=518898 RepID=A0ABY1RYA8_9GAMM|nr:AsmA-like C-terminal region-containing protein [Marinobacterium sediminicola]ULG68684.1 hypothetical protein LN244_13415 [Marinobacterium sediminicola]SMR73207.1 TIGR02099 family protein [Marinobacterium sediminicola]